MRHHADESLGWRVTDHVCRVCFGRVLESMQSQRVRCADCGLDSEGSASAICCCGAKLATGKDMGLRCKRNELITLDVPQQVSVEYVAVNRRQPRTAKAKDFSATLGQAVLDVSTDVRRNTEE